MARRGLASGSVKALDNDYVKMARDMEVPAGGGEGGERAPATAAFY